MKNKRKQKNKANFTHRPVSLRSRRVSIRGGLVKTKDTQAIFVALIGMLFFFVFSILSVINNNSETKGKENDEEINQIKERIFRILQ
jgi:hypothetical protein